ncbi:hypothetical protein MNV49_000383 [Pseudohyphozyma bogoriensis]|nr:hypothetical protein MNV49_000383 [Pseudohyphozyma bogoriensis]
MFGAAVVPGNSQANMFFTLYSSDSVTQAMNMAVDLKLAQYTKIPPWTTLGMQILGTVVGAILQLVIMYQIIDAHRDILLSVEGTNIWSGANVQSFNTQAITWGAMAKHMYGPSSKYLVIPLGVIIGLACPLPFYFLHRIWPRVGFNLVATPLALYGIGYLNSGINSEHFVAIILAFFSQWYLRKYRPTWFRKKLYILSAALDGGMDWFVFIFTFAVAGAGGKTTYFPLALSI